MRTVRVNNLWVVAALITACGCASPAEPSAAGEVASPAFRPFARDGGTGLDLKLARAGAQHEVFRVTAPGSRHFNRLRVEFAPMSQATFERLMDTYGGWSATKSRVRYESGRSYTLADFLPPAIQATDSMFFMEQKESLPLPAGSGSPSLFVQSTTNCFATAYANLRLAQNKDDPFFVFTMGMPAAIKYAGPSSHSRAILEMGVVPPSGDSIHTRPVDRNRGLQPGDMLVISRGPEMLHQTMFVDDDIFFEKAGPEGNVYQAQLYRFIDFQTIYELYGEPGTNFVVRRYDQAPLPPVEDALGTRVTFGQNGASRVVHQAGGRSYMISRLDFEFDPQTGRARLPPAAFEQKMFSSTPD